MGANGLSQSSGRASLCAAGGRRWKPALPRRWGRERRDIEEFEGVGADGKRWRRKGESLGGGGPTTGDDVPEVCVGLLP